MVNFTASPPPDAASPETLREWAHRQFRELQLAHEELWRRDRLIVDWAFAQFTEAVYGAMDLGAERPGVIDGTWRDVEMDTLTVTSMKVELEAPPGRFRFETAGVKLLLVTLGRSFAEAQQRHTIQIQF